MAALAYRPSVDAAGSCSYLSDGMSPLVVHEHLIRAAAALVLVQASRSAITRVDSECGRTNQPQDRMPPLQAPISTGNGCVCVGGAVALKAAAVLAMRWQPELLVDERTQQPCSKP